MSNKVMNTNDAPVAKFAEVFVTRNGKRNAMLMCKDFEGKANISTQDVPRMGSVIMGKKPTTVELSFTMTIYKCTEIFDGVVDEFIKTGVMPLLTIQTSNEDPATSVGRSTKVYNDGKQLTSNIQISTINDILKAAGIAYEIKAKVEVFNIASV